MRKIIDEVYRSKHPNGVYQTAEEKLAESYFPGAVQDTSVLKVKVNKVEDLAESLGTYIDAAMQRLGLKRDKDGIALASLIAIQTVEMHLAKPLTYFVYYITTSEVKPIDIKDFFYGEREDLISMYDAVFKQLLEEYSDVLLGLQPSGNTIESIADF